jgi:SAM-dependent methyltransferase
MQIDEKKLNELLGKAIVDFGATWQAPLIVLGDRLGLFKAMAGQEPMTSQELAERTGTSERYVREWLRAQAAGGYVTYHPENDRYSLSPEQALLLADENSPMFVPPAFENPVEAIAAMPQVGRAFRTGKGVGWQSHTPEFFCAVERFFRPGYAAYLASEWIPALNGVEQKLKRGAQVADIGCGHGASTILMAQAYPESRFIGFDFHDKSIATARRRAKEAGLDGRVRFEVATAKLSNGALYDLITMFDCLHDMGDPVGAARQAHHTLADDGVLMIVEPRAGDRVEENLNPIGRAFYSASTMVCTPCSLDQEVGMALGSQAGEKRLAEVIREGGFTRFRRAAETPFNMIFEARP